MTHDQYNDFCRALPATTYVMQWGGSHVWKVGGKVFAIGTTAKTDTTPEQPAYTFKVSDMNYELLQEEAGFRPAPYLASRGMKWLQVYDNLGFKHCTQEDLEHYIRESHRIVSLGLTKKKQKELGLNQP